MYAQFDCKYVFVAEHFHVVVESRGVRKLLFPFPVQLPAINILRIPESRRNSVQLVLCDRLTN